MDARTVWVAKDDGSDIIRADAIAGVGRYYNGHITARLAGGEGSAVTLVAPASSGVSSTPEDFHRQLIRITGVLSQSLTKRAERRAACLGRGRRLAVG